MAGHSHWAGIKYKKAANDARRGKMFSKMAKALMVAARAGADPQFNARLRQALGEARAVSMPADRIEHAVKKGSGQLEGQSLEEAVYEAYGPGGVALYISAITDNRNRTTPEIRKILSQKNGSLAAQNSVAWQFKRMGIIVIRADGAEEDALLELTLEAGAEDFSREGEVFEIITGPENFEAVKAALEAADIPVRSASVEMVAENLIEVDVEVARRSMELIETLEDHDDVQRVSANFNIPGEVLAEMG